MVTMTPELVEKLKLLRHVPLLDRVDDVRLRLLADKMQHMHVSEGTVVVREKDPADMLYIITTGNVIVSKQRDYHKIKLAELGPGDFFGEIAVIRNIPRTATITAKTACNFLTIDKKSFLHQYEEFPPHIRDDMQVIIAKRLQEAGRV